MDSAVLSEGCRTAKVDTNPSLVRPWVPALVSLVEALNLLLVRRIWDLHKDFAATHNNRDSILSSKAAPQMHQLQEAAIWSMEWDPIRLH